MSENPAASAALVKLNVSPGATMPNFWGERTSFALHLASDVEAVDLELAATDPAASIAVNGQPVESDGKARVLTPIGWSRIEIVVTSADAQASCVYEVKAQRRIPQPDWRRHLEHAPWKERDSQGEVVHDGKIFILGGYTPELVSDVWASEDGQTWTHVGNLPDDAGVNIPFCVSFAGKIWVTSQTGRLWSSPDGASWTLVSEQPPWGHRYGAGSAVFRDRMWVVGGGGSFVFDGEQPTSGVLNDVWSSADGVEWICETRHADWSPRMPYDNVVVHQEALWVFGGGGPGAYQPFRAYEDVWRSEDGRRWEKVLDQAPWTGRIWTSAAAYANRLWLVGGFRAQPKWTNFDDVWHSPDGVAWTRLETESRWSERHEASVLPFKGRLWMIGGNAWPLVNDVWSLDATRMAFVTQPPLEEHTGCEYRYQARADYHPSAGAVRYAMVEGPAWLTIDADTGLLVGRAGERGACPITLEARDASNSDVTARQQWTLRVL